jgi:hypothetical protein
LSVSARDRLIESSLGPLFCGERPPLICRTSAVLPATLG